MSRFKTEKRSAFLRAELEGSRLIELEKRYWEAVPNIWASAQTIETITSDSTLTGSNGVLLVDASGGAVTLTLPPAGDVSGRVHIIKKIDSSGNSVTIDPDSSELIDGELTAVISVQWTSLTIKSNGIGWYIL